MSENFHYDQKKKDTVVCLAGAGSITTGKKRYSCLSDGCAVLAIMTKKKKRYSRMSGGLCCMLYQFLVLAGNWQFFCCGGKFSLRPEKKRYSRLSGGYAINYDRKKKIQSSVCWVRGSGDYDRKKKKKKDKIINIQFVLIKLELKLIQIR